MDPAAWGGIVWRILKGSASFQSSSASQVFGFVSVEITRSVQKAHFSPQSLLEASAASESATPRSRRGLDLALIGSISPVFVVSECLSNLECTHYCRDKDTPDTAGVIKVIAHTYHSSIFTAHSRFSHVCRFLLVWAKIVAAQSVIPSDAAVIYDSKCVFNVGYKLHLSSAGVCTLYANATLQSVFSCQVWQKKNKDGFHIICFFSRRAA